MDLERAASLLKAAIKRLFGFYVIRPVQRFNVENRSEKVLEKEKVKPRAAPKHPGTQDLYKRIVSEHPEIKKEIDERSESLLDRLRSVRVRSHDQSQYEYPEEKLEKDKSKLPQERHTSQLPLHGFVDPVTVLKGKLALKDAIQFISQHAEDPQVFNSELIAQTHQLDQKDVENILKYFKLFQLHMPVEQYDKQFPLLSLHRFSYLKTLKPSIENMGVAVYGPEYRDMLKKFRESKGEKFSDELTKPKENHENNQPQKKE